MIQSQAHLHHFWVMTVQLQDSSAVLPSICIYNYVIRDVSFMQTCDCRIFCILLLFHIFQQSVHIAYFSCVNWQS